MHGGAPGDEGPEHDAEQSCRRLQQARPRGGQRADEEVHGDVAVAQLGQRQAPKLRNTIRNSLISMAPSSGLLKR